jgi:hypothetical protein
MAAGRARAGVELGGDGVLEREGSDTKTVKSRRTLGLPQAAVQALRDHRKRQAEDRLAAGS